MAMTSTAERKLELRDSVLSLQVRMQAGLTADYDDNVPSFYGSASGGGGGSSGGGGGGSGAGGDAGALSLRRLGRPPSLTSFATSKPLSRSDVDSCASPLVSPQLDPSTTANGGNGSGSGSGPLLDASFGDAPVRASLCLNRRKSCCPPSTLQPLSGSTRAHSACTLSESGDVSVSEVGGAEPAADAARHKLSTSAQRVRICTKAAKTLQAGDAASTSPPSRRSKAAAAAAAAAAAVADAARDKARMAEWLRDRGRNDRVNKRLWRSVAERFERLPADSSLDACALWLYRSIATYQSHYTCIDEWAPARLKGNMHNLSLKVDDMAPCLKQAGLTGAQFLALTADELGRPPFSLPPEARKEVLFLVGKLKAGGGGGKGGLVPCEAQVARVLAAQAQRRKDATGWGSSAVVAAAAAGSAAGCEEGGCGGGGGVGCDDTLQFLEGALAGAVGGLPRVTAEYSAGRRVYKYSRCTESADALCGGRLAAGATLSWPYHTSAGVCPELLHYLAHYQKLAGAACPAPGTDVTVLLVPLVDPLNPASKRRIASPAGSEDGPPESRLRVVAAPAPATTAAAEGGRGGASGGGASADDLMATGTDLAFYRRRSSTPAADEGGSGGDEDDDESSGFDLPPGCGALMPPPAPAVAAATSVEDLDLEGGGDGNGDLARFQSGSADVNNGTATASQKLQRLAEGSGDPFSEVVVPPHTVFSVACSCATPDGRAALAVAVEELAEPLRTATAHAPARALREALGAVVDAAARATAPPPRRRRCRAAAAAAVAAAPPPLRHLGWSVEEVWLANGGVAAALLQEAARAAEGCRRLVSEEESGFVLLEEVESRFRHVRVARAWLGSWFVLSAGVALLEAQEAAGRAGLAQLREARMALFEQHKEVLAAKRVPEAKACWLMQQLEDPEVAAVAALVIGVCSHRRTKCLALATCALRDTLHYQLLRMKASKNVVFYTFMFAVHVHHYLGRHCEFLQQFSLQDATAACQLHVDDASVAQAYLTLWGRLGRVTPSCPLAFSHNLLEKIMEAHRSRDITCQVLGAVAVVTKELKGAVSTSQPNLQAWVVRRALENLDNHRVLRQAVAITCNMAETTNELTKCYLYQQGAGKLVLAVISAVGWSDVALLRRALGALVRMLSSLEVAWRTAVTDAGVPVLARVLADGAKAWPGAMKHARNKKDWVKARSLALRAQVLLGRV